MSHTVRADGSQSRCAPNPLRSGAALRGAARQPASTNAGPIRPGRAQLIGSCTTRLCRAPPAPGTGTGTRHGARGSCIVQPGSGQSLALVAGEFGMPGPVRRTTVAPPARPQQRLSRRSRGTRPPAESATWHVWRRPRAGGGVMALVGEFSRPRPPPGAARPQQAFPRLPRCRRRMSPAWCGVRGSWRPDFPGWCARRWS